jgi:hypothetical protein
MRLSLHEENPYRPLPTSETARGKSISVRRIGCAVLSVALGGGLALLGISVVPLTMMLEGGWQEGRPEWQELLKLFVGAIMWTLAGGLWMWTAVCIWKCKDRQAAYLAISGFAILAIHQAYVAIAIRL